MIGLDTGSALVRSAVQTADAALAAAAASLRGTSRDAAVEVRAAADAATELGRIVGALHERYPAM